MSWMSPVVEKRVREACFPKQRIIRPPVLMTKPKEGWILDGPKIGRNDPCPCKSGKKWKKCHGRGSE